MLRGCALCGPGYKTQPVGGCTPNATLAEVLKYVTSLGVVGPLHVGSVDANGIVGGESVRVLIHDRGLNATYIVDASRGFGVGMKPTALRLELVSSSGRPAPAPKSTPIGAPFQKPQPPIPKPTQGNCTAAGPWPMSMKACITKQAYAPLWTSKAGTCVPVGVTCNGPQANPWSNLYPSKASCEGSCGGGKPDTTKPAAIAKPNCSYVQNFRTMIGCPRNSAQTVYSFMAGKCTPVQQDCNGPHGGPDRNVFPTLAACEAACDRLGPGNGGIVYGRA